MNNNPNVRTTSQIVYTSVDDDMTVTEIICEYDCDDAVPEAVCEVEAPDLPRSHIYADGYSGPHSNASPVIKEEKIYLDSGPRSNASPVIKEEKIYLDSDIASPEHNFSEEKIYLDDVSNDAVNQIFTEDKKFKCGVCCGQFDDLPTISRHMEEHSGEKKYECAECGKQFKNINNVMRHMVVHSGERKYMCPICQKPFTQVGNLKRHMFVHSGEKKFPCNICGKGFTQMNNLIRHQAIHSGLKSFQCNLCHRLFNQASNLNRHLLIHRGIKLFKCEVCDRAFSQLTNLQKHKERHIRGKKYKCEVCSAGFDHKLVYNKHLEHHYGKPRFKCKVCGRVVTQKSTLNQHMLLHHENKKYNCQQCNKSYAQKGSLTKHMEAHNQVKYFCKICNRYFYDEGGLLKHESTHTDKAKSIAGMVQQEIKIVDYDLQFCEICGKSFILKRSLRRHMEKTHNVIMEVKRKVSCRENPCEVCGKIFVHRKSLRKHMFRKHDIEMELEAEMPGSIIKIEKENDLAEEDTEESRVIEVAAESDFDQDKIAETLLHIKQENIIEADSSYEEREEFWDDISSCRVKGEPALTEVGGATVHLCEICGRGYYLISNLHRHMQSKHGIITSEKDYSIGKVDDTTSVQMVNDYILKETVTTDKELAVEPNNCVMEVTETIPKSIIKKEIEDDVSVKAVSNKKVRGRKRKHRLYADADICDICGRGFLTPFDLLIHMLQHSKAKKNELLNVVNEAAQEFQSLKKSEAALGITEKTKDLVSHFRKCSRKQSDEISSVFSITEPYEEHPARGIGLSRLQLSGESGCGLESIVSECLDVGVEVRQKVIEINEYPCDSPVKLKSEVVEGV